MAMLIKQKESGIEPIVSLPLGSAFAAGDARREPASAAASRNPEVASLEDAVASLRQLLEAKSAELDLAVAAARTEARKEADRAHARDDAQALSVLQESLASATHRIEAQLQEAQGLALLLCRSALEKVLGSPDAYADLVEKVIAHQIDYLRAENVLTVAVSAQDFADKAKFSALNQKLGNRITLSADPKLDRGACRMDLKLGQVEFSAPRYWEQLQQMLKQLAGGRR